MAKPKIKWDRQAGNDNAKALREAAKQRYGGKTAKQYRQENSKFKKLAPKGRNGRFEVVSTFLGNPAPQIEKLPNSLAAYAVFQRLAKNPRLEQAKLVEWVNVKNDEGMVVGQRATTLFSYTHTDQIFANSRFETLYVQKGDNKNGVFSWKVIQNSPKMMQLWLENQIEVFKEQAVGGFAWWEERA